MDDRRTVLIAGAGSGLGAECARLFAATDARLVLVDRNRTALDALNGKLHAHDTLVIDGDLARSETAGQIVEAALALTGRIDALVYSAGVDPLSATTVVDTSDDDWAAIMEVNVSGAFYLSRAALPTMIARGGGSIVTIASVSALKPSPAEAAYSVSKAALLQLTKAIALDHAKDGIRANCVCPGMLEAIMADRRADMSSADMTARSEAAAAAIPIGREGRYAEIASLVAFLADPAQSSYVTGAALVADGGYLLA